MIQDKDADVGCGRSRIALGGGGVNWEIGIDIYTLLYVK